MQGSLNLSVKYTYDRDGESVIDNREKITKNIVYTIEIVPNSPFGKPKVAFLCNKKRMRLIKH